MPGWIKLHRDFLNHWIYDKSKPFSFKEAWIDILLNVNHKKTKVNIGFDIFDCQPGQSLLSIKSWAERWGWSDSRVKRFFKLIKKDGIIETENVKKSTRITVVNWHTYQSDRTASESQVNRKRTASESQVTTNKNDKNERMKEEKKRSVSKKPKRLKSSWKNSPTKMKCDQFVAKMLESSQRHVQIIGHLADEMKPGLETKGQWQVFFDRYKKEASILVPFTDDQLDYGCRKAITNHPDIWTLETIKKEILKRKNGEK